VKGTEHSTTKGPDVARWFLHYVYDSKERSGVVIDFAVDASYPIFVFNLVIGMKQRLVWVF
jgi:hypothetical protein